MVDMFEIIPNSFYACLLVSVAVGIIGSLIVINRNSFIAGSIAHGSFGGVGIGLYFGLPILLSTSLFGALLALLLSAITLKIPHRSDAIIGAIWAIGMSVGIIFVELSPGYGDGVISYLFGSILTISDSDILCGKSVGCKTIKIGEDKNKLADFCCNSLIDCVEIIKNFEKLK